MSAVADKKYDLASFSLEEFPFTFHLKKVLEGAQYPESKRDELIKQLAQRSLSNRFIYKVTDVKNNLAAYLIGTLHDVSSVVAKDPVMHKVIEQSGIVFFERSRRVGGNKGDELAHIIDPEIPEFDCDLDASLARHALLKKKETAGFLSEEEGKEQEQSFDQCSSSNTCPELNWINKLPQDIIPYVLYEIYLQGDTQKMYAMFRTSEVYNKFIVSLNKNWMYDRGFVQLLKQNSEGAQKPACLVVGVAHLLGKKDEDGIIPILRREGFTVERINSL